jgi:protein O-GlcNAc transferase
VNYQRIYHLTPANLAPYDALTFPSLQERWRGQPPSGELVAVTAVVAGEMVGLAVAEILAEAKADLLSVYVLPEYCQQGIEAMLVEYLKRAN